MYLTVRLARPEKPWEVLRTGKMTKVYIEPTDDSGYSMSREDLHKYCDYVGTGADGVAQFRLKPQYREGNSEKAINAGLAGLGAVLRLFGL